MFSLSYSPKSQALRVAAWGIWAFALAGIHVETGWELRSTGPPLAVLATLVLLIYLSSGVKLSIDRVQDRVRTRRRLVGVPVWSSTRHVALEAVELRAAWMRRARAGRVMVYDLLAVGHEPGADGDVAIELKEDLMYFRFAEARARAAASELNLPLVMRWDRVLDCEPVEHRDPNDLRRPLSYPDALRDWKAWT